MLTRRVFLQALTAAAVIPALPSIAAPTEQQFMLMYWRKVGGVWEWVQEALIMPIDRDFNDVAATVIGDVYSQGSEALAMVRVSAFDECDLDQLNAIKQAEYMLLMDHETEEKVTHHGVVYCAAAYDRGVVTFPANGDGLFINSTLGDKS